jgi:hypothetical protein
MDDKDTASSTTPEGAASGLSAELERLRVAAGIELEASFEAGSTWCVGDDELAKLVALAKAEEREACAKVCDQQAEKDRPHQDAGNQPADYRIGYMDGSGDCGHAIRARSNAELWGRRSAASSGPTRTPGSTAETTEDAE